MHTRQTIGFGVLLIAALATPADRDFTIVAEPLFLGTDSPPRVQPYAITVENRGPDTSGTITVESGSFVIEHPIQLPQGSRKRVVTCITGASYFEGYTTLRTPRGNARFKIESRPSSNQQCIAVVSDVAGELGFVRSNKKGQEPITDIYVKPEMAPDRAAAYGGVSAVWLGDGSERLSDDAVFALQRYVSMGGTLVFSGGASMPMFSDPRWRTYLPVLNPVPKTVSLDAIIRGMVVKGDCTVGIGTLAGAATTTLEVERIPFVVERPHGLGKVVYVAANLTEGPAKQWLQREAFVRATGLVQPVAKLMDLVSRDPSSGVSAMGGFAAVPGANSPFQTHVPDTVTVVAILFVYFLLVVPINLIALRKVGKGEWAWVTSPILSLAFAGVFFQFSSGLYSANLSVATTGAVVAHQGDPEATFIGSTQMFFPQGGRYDLRLEGVEAVFADDRFTGNPNQLSALAGLGLIDDGEIRAPTTQVTNLAFREFSLIRRMPMKEPLVVKVERSPGGKPKVVVTNRSGHSLKLVGVVLSDASYSIDSLAPGESKAAVHGYQAIGDMVPNLAQGHVVASGVGHKPAGRSFGMAFALIQNLRAGPAIGKNDESLSRCWLLYGFEEGRP